MYQINLKKYLAQVMMTGVLFFHPALNAATAPAVDECSRELLLSYFPESFVVDTLKKYNVPQDKWDAINKQLASKDKDVVRIVEEKAAQSDPNPLKDSRLRQQAVKLFRDTLFDVFSSVMKANGVTDDKQIQAMLDDIQQQKAVRFAKCMEKNRPELSNKPSEASAK